MKRLVIVLLGLWSSTRVKNDYERSRREFDNAVHFKYKNHQYIKFVEGFGQYKISGVVHDPDCKYCK